MVGQAWRSNWERVRPFFAFPREVRELIYTTNAIESMNSTLRKVVRVRAATSRTTRRRVKLLYLAIRNLEKKWTRPADVLEPRPQSVRHHVRGKTAGVTGRALTQKSGQSQ